MIWYIYICIYHGVSISQGDEPLHPQVPGFRTGAPFWRQAETGLNIKTAIFTRPETPQGAGGLEGWQKLMGFHERYPNSWMVYNSYNIWFMGFSWDYLENLQETPYLVKNIFKKWFPVDFPFKQSNELYQMDGFGLLPFLEPPPSPRWAHGVLREENIDCMRTWSINKSTYVPWCWKILCIYIYRYGNNDRYCGNIYIFKI